VTNDLFWGVTLSLAVIAVMAFWFHACGRADHARALRAFARRTLVYAIPGFLVGLAFLTSDLGPGQPQGRMGLVAITVCCFLLVYSAAFALTAANDTSLVIVNLTGRSLVLKDPDLAAFNSLPSIQEQPATTLPPARPRTFYVVSRALGEESARAGRTDVLTVDTASARDPGAERPLIVRRLLRAVPAATAPVATDRPQA